MRHTSRLLLFLLLVLFSSVLASYDPAKALRVSFNLEHIDNPPADGRTCLHNGDTYINGNPSSSDLKCGETEFISSCYGICKEFEVLSDAAKTLIKSELLPSISQFAESLVSLRQNSTASMNVTLSGCADEDGALVKFLPSVVPFTDLYIIVTARPIVESSRLTYSKECAQDPTTRRSTVVLLNISPIIILLSKSLREYTMKQELIHALGFTETKMREFIDSNGQPRNAFTVSQVSGRGDVENIATLSTPKLLQVAKQFYNCSSITGLELENYNIPFATRYNHWERRIFLNELMTAQITTNPGKPVLSEFTLAVLEDSGWYEPNYNLKEQFTFGLMAGCSFIQSRCENWKDTRYFCAVKNEQAQCTHDLKGKGKCDLGLYSSNLKPFYQHFDAGNKGGTNVFSDYCPYVIQNVGGDCTDVANKNAQRDEASGELFGTTSRCFISDTAKSSTLDTPTSRCFDSACDAGALYLKVADNWYKCPEEGGLIDNVWGFYGTVTCPPAFHVCPAGFTSSNMNDQVRDPNQNRNVDDAINKFLRNIGNLPYWVWIIVGGVCFIALAACVITCAVCIVHRQRAKKWKIKKVVDARNRRSV